MIYRFFYDTLYGFVGCHDKILNIKSRSTPWEHGCFETSIKRQGTLKMASRSLNVLKKNEKGLLTEYQRSFFSGRNLLQRADAILTENSKRLVTDNR